jgi:DNA-binding NarL/FixJ family response regulator
LTLSASRVASTDELHDMSAKVARTPRPRTKEQADPHAFETLVRQLVARAQLAPPAASPPRTRNEREETDDDSSEVLVDLEVDGVRCVLARAHTSSADELRLSPREREVARMIAKGYPNKIIASVLDISVWTVSTHLRRIFAKLGVTSRAAMVTTIFKRGKL